MSEDLQIPKQLTFADGPGAAFGQNARRSYRVIFSPSPGKEREAINFALFAGSWFVRP